MLWKVINVVGRNTGGQKFIALGPDSMVVPILNEIIKATLNDLRPQPVKEVALKPVRVRNTIVGRLNIHVELETWMKVIVCFPEEDNLFDVEANIVREEMPGRLNHDIIGALEGNKCRSILQRDI